MQESKRSRVEPTSGKEIFNKKYPDQPVSIGNTISLARRQALISLLKKYKHVFSWIPTNMVGVDRKVIGHKLMIKPGTKETKQKRRIQGGDMNKAINADVAKLTKAGIFGKAVLLTWIVNPVME